MKQENKNQPNQTSQRELNRQQFPQWPSADEIINWQKKEKQRRKDKRTKTKIKGWHGTRH